MMAPMAAAVAGLDPEIAAKMAQAAIVTTARPPGRCPTQVRRQAMRYLEMPPWDMTTPANTNEGIASSGGDKSAANMRWAIM